MTAEIVKGPLLTEIICGEDRTRQAVRFHLAAVCVRLLYSSQLKSCLCLCLVCSPRTFYIRVCVCPSCSRECFVYLLTSILSLFKFSTGCSFRSRLCVCAWWCLSVAYESLPSPAKLPGAELIGPADFFDLFIFFPQKGHAATNKHPTPDPVWRQH